MERKKGMSVLVALLGVSVVFLGMVPLAFGQGGGGVGTGGTGGGGTVGIINPLDASGTGCTLTCVLNKVLGFLIAIAIPITAIMVIWGAFQMITASGDPEKFGKGRKTLVYAAIGFAVVLLSSSVAPLISNILGAK